MFLSQNRPGNQSGSEKLLQETSSDPFYPRKKLVPRIVAILVILTLSSSLLLPQMGTGTLLGSVHQQTGSPAANISITVHRINTNETFLLNTNSKGDYRKDGLFPSIYQIIVSQPGYTTQIRTQIQLSVGQTLREDFFLREGDSSIKTTARSKSILSGLERQDRGRVINQEKLENLPVNSRDMGQLANLAAGAAPSSESRNRTIKVLGMGKRDNLTYIDGTLFTHGDGGSAFQASIDALKEFDIKTGLYSSEYGIRPGGQIVAITKSGTNELHGNLFWFHRNDNLDARNFFEQEKAEFKRNQLGATVGGPLLPSILSSRNRAWFFFSYQFRSIRETKPLMAVVPTSTEKEGQFTVPIRDPVTGNFFPENRIPQARLDSVSARLLHYWPKPNTLGALNFTSPDSLSRLDNPQIISRIDLKTSDISRWAGRFVWNSNHHNYVKPFNTFSARHQLSTLGQVLSYTRTLSTKAQNVSSIHWFRRPYELRAAQRQVTEEIGIPELLNTNVDRTGVPTIRIQGYTGIGDYQYNGPTSLGNWEAKNDLFMLEGDHALKMGIHFRSHYNLYATERRARFTFFDRYTGNGFADYLLGYLSQSETGGEFSRGRFHQNSYYMYLHDTWRISPVLTVNLGLRYEVRLPWKDKRGFMSNFDPATGQIVPNLLNLELKPGETGRFQPSYPLIRWNYLDGLLPRIGFSWRAMTKTVLRIGYGIYSNEPDLQLLLRLGRNPRPGVNHLIFNSSLDKPSLRFSNPFPQEQLNEAIPDHHGIETPMSLSRTHSWGLSLQHKFSSHWLLDSGYHGSTSTHRLETVSLNDAVPGPGDRQLRRNWPHLQGVFFPMADADSWFHGMHVQLEKAAGPDGLYLLSSFSWSRLIQTGGTTGGFHSFSGFRSRNVSLTDTRGVADLHIPRRLMLSSGYDFPFGPDKILFRKGWISRILQGWSIRAISNFQDGGWQTITLPGDPLDSGSEASQWPDRVGDANLPVSKRTPARWFKTEAFTQPSEFLYGNAGKGVVEIPGLFNLDISLRRTFLLKESQRLEVRLEAFNATNRSNFVVTSRHQTLKYGTSGFGALAQTLPARQIQLALKFYY